MPHPSTAPAHLSSLLRRCAAVSALRPGRQAHVRALVSGLLPHPTLETDILLMYARCGQLPLARQVFDQMPDRPLHSWNILLSSYAQSALFHYALALLPPLLSSGLYPDHFTLPSLLKSSAGINDGLAGAALHALAITLALNIRLVVSGSIVDMYAKCGRLCDASKLFDEMPERDGTVWNAIITGFIKAGLFAEALSLFRQSQLEAVDADWMAVPSVLSACSHGGDWRRGKEIHCRAIRLLVSDSDVAVGNSLIDMYSKCGCLDASRRIFARMRVRNLVAWSVMISCYAFHTRGKEALRLFEKMRAQGLQPNSIVFTSLLSSCSHSGLIDAGRAIFCSISRVYGFEPSMEHCACMVDLLGRHGKIEEALDFIEKMAVEPAASVWGALLAACAAHRNVEVGEIAARELFVLEPDNPSNYAGLCGIYEKAGNWNGAAEMRRKMKALGMVKTPGCSWIDVKGKRHGFYQGDASCPFSRRMMGVFRGLLGQSQFLPLDEV
ncbi:Pentatricopeptide repeat-containing protein [Platanthera zijinensis]|uniref:Pentatricopeptide repeat-containing protein n=1 Tax=Platanthera zijinensis TaxID=2320716 RepID=A0AAP0GCU0_9ASPA